MAAQFSTFLKHLWLDADDASRVISPNVLQQLTALVAVREQSHHGQIRICIEASLPLSYLWRVGPHHSLSELVRERALMMFSKLRVWDTAHNSGVLIYVLLAEHAIEVVADRGMALHISSAQWAELVTQMSEDFKTHSYQDGLTRAIDAVSSLLVQHFPRRSEDGLPGASRPSNELPDAPVLL